MRQIIAIVPRWQGQRALRIAQDNSGTNLVLFKAEGPDPESEVVLIHVPNRKVDPLAEPIEVRACFTRAEAGGQNALLILACLQKFQNVSSPDQALKDQLNDLIQERIEQEGFQATPWVDLTLLSGPAQTKSIQSPVPVE